MNRRPRAGGAALLLLLAVLGLGGAALFVGAPDRLEAGRAAREAATLLTLARAREALIGFALANGRLPRPAASAVDGSEQAAECGSEAGCSGLLPWAALGVAGSDGWGKRLRYSVTPSFTRVPIDSVRVVASKALQTRDGAGQLRYLAGRAHCAPAAPCVPAVLVSHGEHNFGVSEAGVAQANAGAGNLDEQANAAAATLFISRPRGTDPAMAGGAFDDLVGSVPLDLLFGRMRAAGNLP